MVASHIKKVVVGSIAVSACTLVVACGGGKKNQSPPPAPQAPVRPTQTTPPDRSVLRDTRSTRELDRDASDSQRRRRTTDDDERKRRTTHRDDSDGYADGENPWDEDPSGSGSKVRVVNIDPKLIRPDSIFSKKGDSVGTGAATGVEDGNGRPVIFSGASNDNLVALLRDRLENVSDEQQRRANLEFAGTIGLTTVDIDWNTRALKVTTLLERYGKREHYTLHGRLGADFKGTFGNKEAWPNIAGDLVCMDLNGGCRNMRLRFVDFEGAEKRVAFIVVRGSLQETNAWMYSKGKHPESSDNPEFRRLMNIFIRTVKKSGQINATDYLNFTTSETVNGSSTFTVTLRMRVYDPFLPRGGTQILMFSGPLVKTDNSNKVNAEVSQAVSLTEVDGQPIPVNPDHGHISDTLKSVQLVQNDGHGNIQLQLNVRANKPDIHEERILLTIGRKHNQVKYLDL